jgi:hypothetical protein
MNHLKFIILSLIFTSIPIFPLLERESATILRVIMALNVLNDVFLVTYII